MEKKDIIREITVFSSLSESGFIPTYNKRNNSFTGKVRCSHLFQRVASFLHLIKEVSVSLMRLGVLISFREWLHSYAIKFLDSLSDAELVLISFREWLHSYSGI